jgi:hypothetical protein
MSTRMFIVKVWRAARAGAAPTVTVREAQQPGTRVFTSGEAALRFMVDDLDASDAAAPPVASAPGRNDSATQDLP